MSVSAVSGWRLAVSQNPLTLTLSQWERELFCIAGSPLPSGEVARSAGEGSAQRFLTNRQPLTANRSGAGSP
jgi:hypothetical protein